MPEVHIVPDREKAARAGHADAAAGVHDQRRLRRRAQRPLHRQATSATTSACGCLEQQRESPDQLDDLYVKTRRRASWCRCATWPTRRSISTLPVINRYNHLRKVELTANMAPGVSQGEAIARCLEIAEEVREEMEPAAELPHRAAGQRPGDAARRSTACGARWRWASSSPT